MATGTTPFTRDDESTSYLFTLPKRYSFQAASVSVRVGMTAFISAMTCRTSCPNSSSHTSPSHLARRFPAEHDHETADPIDLATNFATRIDSHDEVVAPLKSNLRFATALIYVAIVPVFSILDTQRLGLADIARRINNPHV